MISDPFVKVLSAGRAHFNKQVADARRRYPAFDTAAFTEFLQTGVDPVVRAVAAVNPDRVPQVVLAAYRAALELSTQSLAGPTARSDGVNQVWRELAPRFAHLIAYSPSEVLGLLTNAVVHLEKTATVRPATWIAELAKLAPQVESLAHLQALGQLLAWRAGLSHFRQGALAVADRLPAPLLAGIFGIEPGEWPAARDAMLADPWWGAGGHFGGVEIGAFSGFGGEFAEPPQLRACDDGFLVKSGERYFLLVADVHGAVLHTSSGDEFAAAASASWPAPVPLSIDLDLPLQQLTVIRNAHTRAVTSPFTHAIRLLPLQ